MPQSSSLPRAPTWRSCDGPAAIYGDEHPASDSNSSTCIRLFSAFVCAFNCEALERMDPLSLTVSSIALITTALDLSKSLVNLIKSFIHLPDDLQSLSQEIQDLRTILATAESTLKANSDTQRPGEIVAAFPILLRRLTDKLGQIDDFCRGFIGPRPSARAVKTIDWAIRGEGKCNRLRGELKSLKWNISTSISAIAASSSLNVGLHVEKVELEVRSLGQSVTSSRQALLDQDKQHSLAVDRLTESQQQLKQLLDSKLEDIRSDLDETSANMFLSGQLNSLLPPTAIAVHLSLQQRAMCVPSCSCICHVWRRFKSPRVLERLIGSLVLGYTGVPLIATKCLDQRCQSQATYAVRFCYRFPLWALAKAVTFAVYSRYGNPTAGLSMAQIRPHSARVFSLAESGDATGMKALFDHGLASPFDISAQTGDQPLHITADHGFVDASRLLVGYGADPHAWDQSQQNTPHSNAWNTILAANIPRKMQVKLSLLFTDATASYDFPRLHEVILGLKVGDLAVELSKSGCDVNVRDSDGNTALQWACLRGDTDAATILLQNGADANLPNWAIGRTPLMAACCRPSIPCISLLLDYGADINDQTRHGLDALIYLVEEDRDPQPLQQIIQVAQLLISRGISLVPRGANKVWCLARAARTQYLDVMALILAGGVSINHKTGFGMTALMRSIGWSAFRSVEFLLRNGASYTGDERCDDDGRTILHLTALNLKMETVRVLIEADLAGLDPDDVDKDGLTAEDYVAHSGKNDIAPETMEAFGDLIGDLRAKNGRRETLPIENIDALLDIVEKGEGEVWYDPSTEEMQRSVREEFFDALETWEV